MQIIIIDITIMYKQLPTVSLWFTFSIRLQAHVINIYVPIIFFFTINGQGDIFSVKRGICIKWNKTIYFNLSVTALYCSYIRCFYKSPLIIFGVFGEMAHHTIIVHKTIQVHCTIALYYSCPADTCQMQYQQPPHHVEPVASACRYLLALVGVHQSTKRWVKIQFQFSHQTGR